MSNKITIDQGFSVIGMTLRTTNKAAMSVGSIAQLWQQFLTENAYSKIPNKIDGALIALYYDFENDKNGQYTVLLGARVSSIETIPAGMVAHQVSTQKRVVFTSERGSMPNIVFDLWNKIWTLEDECKIDRSYDADYELYENLNQDPEKSLMTIHIGVK